MTDKHGQLCPHCGQPMESVTKNYVQQNDEGVWLRYAEFTCPADQVGVHPVLGTATDAEIKEAQRLPN